MNLKPTSALVILALLSLSAYADSNLDSDVARGRATFDQAAVSGQRTGTPVVDAQAVPTPKAQKVDKKSLKAAYKDVLALRQQVWNGAMKPADFYPAAQKAFEARFGADYAQKVRAFFDEQAVHAERPQQSVAFWKMSDAERAQFFADMPKGAELHLHLTGGVPGDKILDIGEQQGTVLSTGAIAIVLRVKDLSAYGVDPSVSQMTVAQMPPKMRKDLGDMLVSQPGETFAQFLDKWKVITPIIRDPRSYYPMMQYMAAYAKSQNIVYLELMISAFPEVQKGACDAAQRVQAETGVTIRLIASHGWYAHKSDVDSGMAEAEQLAGSCVVGFNMVADERVSPLNHYESFKNMREKLGNLSVSLHAGEQAGTAPNIVNDLLLNAKRYGHTTHVEEDPIAETVLYESRDAVESSLISNEKTHVIKDASQSPQAKLVGLGVPVVPSTDDPGVFGSKLSDEYQAAEQQFGYSWDELKKMSRDGIRYSFADEATKKRLMKDLNARLKKFEHSKEFKKFKIEQNLYPWTQMRGNGRDSSQQPPILPFRNNDGGYQDGGTQRSYPH